MVTETVNPARLIPASHLTTIRNLLAQREEDAHIQFIRNRADLPNLAAYYEGEERGLGLARAIIDGTIKGIASVPEDPMLPRNDTPWGAGEEVEASRG